MGVGFMLNILAGVSINKLLKAMNESSVMSVIACEENVFIGKILFIIFL